MIIALIDKIIKLNPSKIRQFSKQQVTQLQTNKHIRILRYVFNVQFPNDKA